MLNGINVSLMNILSNFIVLFRTLAFFKKIFLSVINKYNNLFLGIQNKQLASNIMYNSSLKNLFTHFFAYLSIFSVSLLFIPSNLKLFFNISSNGIYFPNLSFPASEEVLLFMLEKLKLNSFVFIKEIICSVETFSIPLKNVFFPFFKFFLTCCCVCVCFCFVFVCWDFSTSLVCFCV